MRYLIFSILAVTLFSEVGSAGILARRARARAAVESRYYRYSYTVRTSPRVIIDYDRGPTDNFGRYNGEVVYENGDQWTWD